MSEVTNSKPRGTLFRVRYVNSWEWSDVRSYVQLSGAVRVRYVNSQEWSDVRSYVQLSTTSVGQSVFVT